VPLPPGWLGKALSVVTYLWHKERLKA